jgi:uncharacterized protein (TIGR03545 family)
MTLFRWRAIVVLVLFLVLLFAGWVLLLDLLVERAVEETGASVVGAKVDVASADVRLGEGRVRLRGLAVANPDAPMTNLLEAREIVANVMVTPLLEKKVVVETLAVRGMRFGTPRTTSGALENPSPESGRAWREVNAWAGQLRVPSFTLEGLGGVVNIDAIRPESLRTLAHARATVAQADSMRVVWEGRLRALDPRPQIDSARALVERIQGADPARLGITGVTQLVNSGRSTLSMLGALQGGVAVLDSTVRTGVWRLQDNVREFGAMRDADLAYARGLLNLPSLDAPSISPALFGETAIAWLKPVLYWVKTAERYLPPGLDPKRHSGPQRARASGTTVNYPGRATYPRFLLEYGATDLEIGGTGAAAGQYAALVRGLSSAPSLYGQPVEIAAGRTGAARGPRELRLTATLRHAQRPLQDSVSLYVSGVTLPTVDLSAIGGRLLLGEGTSEFSLGRNGGQIQARLRWVSTGVSWERGRGSQAAGGNLRIGTAAWAKDLVWRTLSGVRRVEVEMRLRGSLEHPSLSVSSNLGQAVARSLRQEVGREIQHAEEQVRAEVDRLLQPRLAEATLQVDALRERVQDTVAMRLDEVKAVQEQLAAELRNLTRGIPGIRIP